MASHVLPYILARAAKSSAPFACFASWAAGLKRRSLVVHEMDDSFPSPSRFWANEIQADAQRQCALLD
jgi:hypothetical protein